MSKLIYLASPYSDPDMAVQDERFRLVCKAAADLMKQGHFIFSPIAHLHPITIHGLPSSWEYWAEYDRSMICRCDEMWVLRLYGWSESKDIEAELKIAYTLGMSVRFIDWPVVSTVVD